MTKKNINNHVTCAAIHHFPQHAKPASQIMAKQWNHKDGEIKRNLQSMLDESKDTLPCHLALVLNIPTDHFSLKDFFDEDLLELLQAYEAGVSIVVGHVKLMKADGRSDGACCISYSLVVDDKFRDYGLGRRLTEEAENYARSLNLSYMYLSTNDKVEFYEHLGYKQCEPVSSLGNNSKRLTASQVSSLEGLFAKRLNISNPTDCNVWLRKRLIEEYSMKPIFQLENMKEQIAEKLTNILYQKESAVAATYIGIVVRLPWQQQTGPSCGISALNMLRGALTKKEDNTDRNTRFPCETCTVVDGKYEKSLKGLDGLTPLTLAIRSGVSNDGELFCSYNLSYLASQSLGINLTVTELFDSKGITDEIIAGRPVLIPYDRDVSNHGPSFSDGGQAHWAVVIGCITTCSNGELDDELCSKLEVPEVNSKLYLLDAAKLQRKKFHCALCFGEEKMKNIDIFLICMHGMSQKPFVCTFTDMLRSNAQLHKSKSKFYMASEDLSHLRGKFLFVKDDFSKKV